MKLKQWDGMNYWVFSPDDWQEPLPLVLFLHGSGERGSNPEAVFHISLPRWLKEGRWAPKAHVLCPQCPAGFDWGNRAEQLKALISREITELGADPSRIVITGLSMGGFGAWEMAICYPRLFSCVVPICGGGLSWRVPNLKEVPVWAFHGDEDQAVPLRNSLEMVDALRAAGGAPRLTILHGVGHACWDEAYGDSRVLLWMLEQKREHTDGYKGDTNS